jgi:phospholipid/cholesterol/gamma-HCH transport system permease protein
MLDAVGAVGTVTTNILESFRFIAKGRISLQHVLTQLVQVGYDSLPVACIICTISGCVLALHGAEQFAQTGAHSYVGALVALAMVREMGPIFTALAVAARAGTGIAAEIANMNATNQTDALQVMHVSPIRYLVVPRLLACIISLPLLTLIAETTGVLGGMLTAKATASIHYQRYLDSVWINLKISDINASLIKALWFGILLAGISVTCGFLAKRSARDVGLAATQATIWTSVAVLVSDFFLTWMLFGTSFSESL